MITGFPTEVEEWAKRLKKKKRSCLGEAVKRTSEFLADSTSITICLPTPFLYKIGSHVFSYHMGPI